VTNTESRGAFYFITEQACCFAQATGTETDDFRVCQDVAEYLAGSGAGALADFRERTEAVKRDLTGLEDYDTEQYEGKSKDVRKAVAELNGLGMAADTPEQVRGLLLRAAEFIAAFYDVENPGVPA